MKRLDYGSDVDVLQNPSFSERLCEMLGAGRRRRFL